jgi:hypothetical protein
MHPEGDEVLLSPTPDAPSDSSEDKTNLSSTTNDDFASPDAPFALPMEKGVDVGNTEHATNLEYLLKGLNESHSSHRKLETSHRALETFHRGLRISHRSLQTSHQTLQRAHNNLKARFLVLEARFNASTERAAMSPMEVLKYEIAEGIFRQLKRY